MKKAITLKITGMHCNNCSDRIKKAVEKLGAINVEVSYEKGLLTCDSSNIDKILSSIKVLGYEGSQIESKEIKKSSYTGIFVGITVLLGLYLIIKSTIGFNYMPQLDENASYPILLILGAITSLHCLTMCGGIVISQSLAFKNPVKSSLLYNAGRVIAYTIVGGIVGGIGSVISFSPLMKGYITIFAGVFMILLGLSMLEPFKFLRSYIKIPKFFKAPSFMGNSKAPFYIGLATGFMPCGPLQTMQLYALGTGSPLKGAIAMFFFSIGTVPLMMGFGTISGYISSGLNKKLLKLSAVLVMVLGVIIINRGLALQGKTTFASAAKQEITSAMLPEIINEYQVITTYANNNGYEPNYFVLEKGRAVKWVIRGEEVNACNNEVAIPSLGINMKVEPGYNVIEFTPEEEGQLGFSCWMGMLDGSFLVVEDLNNLPQDMDWTPAPTTPCCDGER
ncbi:urease accessory protein UreH domain-containing protein [Alkaliphilus serpentinus]|nr:sulfite exporter TauE/SafE family protein [Alkaliphilus serpentinus]